MSDEEDPSPQEIGRRVVSFIEYVCRHRVVLPAVPGRRYACPCCRFLTLEERGRYQICQVCYWEDDGQDNHDVDIENGGPNSGSLAQARLNFAAYGAAGERCKEFVRAPRPEEIVSSYPIVRTSAAGNRVACLCCGFLTLESHDRFRGCSVCGWYHDDPDRDPDIPADDNGGTSLEQARLNFAAYGACNEESRQHARPPELEEYGDG